jgi:hypothetical protein
MMWAFYGMDARRSTGCAAVSRDVSVTLLTVTGADDVGALWDGRSTLDALCSRAKDAWVALLTLTGADDVGALWDGRSTLDS